MSNVVHFGKSTAAPQMKKLRSPSEVLASLSTLPARISEIAKLQTQLKQQVLATITMVDHAVDHAHNIVATTNDLLLKKIVSEYLSSVEGLLEIARKQALNL